VNARKISLALSISLLLFLGGYYLLRPSPNADSKVIRPVIQQREMMGTFIQFQVYGLPEDQAMRVVEQGFAEVAAVEKLAHPRRPESDVFRVNEAAGKEAVSVDPDIYEILALARKVSAHSAGAFDVTYAGVGRLWNIQDPTNFRIPSDEELAEAVKLIDYQRLQLLENNLVRLDGEGMRLNLGGIAKGWAADRAMASLHAAGVENAIVNAGGNMKLNGNKNGKPWRIGIQDPRAPHGKYLGVLEITGDLAVATSGDYERFVERDGVRYHHIIDPKTGRPANLCQSVTILAPTAVLSDALSTAVFVLGPEKGQQMLETYYPDCDALIIDAQGERHFTPHFKAHGGMVEIE